jgi:monovalent cation:H+ antiporter-2, CPA2 family
LDHGPWLKDALVFLAGAGLVVPLFHRARIGAVLGFLCVGIAVGPYGFGRLAADLPWLRYLTIEDRAGVEPFAELGVLFLLFLIGLELSLARLWSLRRYVLGIGALQFVFSALVLRVGMWAMGVSTSNAIVLGLCLAMSSTAIVMQLLEEQGRSATQVGRIALSVLLFQDLMVAPILFGVEILGRGGQHVLLALAIAVLQGAVAILAIVVAGRYLLQPIFRSAARTGSRDLIMAITLFIVVGVAAETGAAGLSTALGAFLAGLLLSETEYRHHIEIDIAPFKGLLIGLFFISVGMTIDLRAVWSNVGVILAAVAALLAIKSVVLFAASRVFRVSVATAAEVAVLLAQGGEFAFVVIALARLSGLLANELAQLATAVVGISMMVTPLCAAGGQWLGRRLQHVDHRHHMPAESASELRDHVVIGGYGRVGQTAARGRERAVRRARYQRRAGGRVAQARAYVFLRRCRAAGIVGARRRRRCARIRGHGQRARVRRAHGGGGAQRAAGRSGLRPRDRRRARGAAARARGRGCDPGSGGGEPAARRPAAREPGRLGGGGDAAARGAARGGACATRDPARTQGLIRAPCAGTRNRRRRARCKTRRLCRRRRCGHRARC